MFAERYSDGPFSFTAKPQPGNYVQIKINNTMNLDSLFYEV
jgi:hypothetical protein